LTIVIIITAVLIAILIGFWIFESVKTNSEQQDAAAAVDNFINNPIDTADLIGPGGGTQMANATDNTVIDLNLINMDPAITDGGNGSSGSVKKYQLYKGFVMLGTIEIPKIDLKYPVLDRADAASMEVAPGVVYGPGLNKVGNTVIAGHNYRNKTFFSKINQLKKGDSIYITDTDKNKVEYIVYNIYTTGSEDNSYWDRDTRGAMENLTTALLEPAEPVDTWEKLRDYVKPVIDKEIEAFNK
jgi:LPXTG-site transpeptidase (sortase) family protein